jgi:O-antigen ligase
MGTLPLSQNAPSLREKLAKRGDFWRTVIYSIGLIVTMAGAYVIGAGQYGTWVIAGVMGIGVTLAVVVRPHYGVYLLVLFVYTNLSTLLMDAFGLPSMNKILVALIFVSVIATQIIMRRKPLVFRSSEAMVLLYIVVTSVSTILGSGANAESFDEIIDVFKDFIIIFIVVQLTHEEVIWRRAQWILIISAMLLSSLTWYQFITGDYANTFYGLATSRVDSVNEDGVEWVDIQRVGGPVGDPNYYAQILVMVLPLSIYRTISQKQSSRRLMAAFCTLLIAGAIVFTYSRATLVVVVLVALLIVLERRINVYKVFAWLLVLFVLAIPVLPKGYTDRMLTILGVAESAESQEDVSTKGRMSEAIVAIQMFRDNPVFGIGYSQYESNYQDYSARLGLDDRTEERQAHNLYLEILAETGVIGMAAFILMIFVIFNSLNQARHQLNQVGRSDLVPWLLALQFGLMAYLLNSIFLHDSFARYLRLSIAMALSATALADALMQKYDQEQRRKRNYGEESISIPETAAGR